MLLHMVGNSFNKMKNSSFHYYTSLCPNIDTNTHTLTYRHAYTETHKHWLKIIELSMHIFTKYRTDEYCIIKSHETILTHLSQIDKADKYQHN